MSSNGIERNRGTKEFRQQIAVLRGKWPLAFPGAAHEIAAVMGWSLPYTLGVLARWKMAPAYCQAVLCYDQRAALDGSPAEMIDAKAKDLAAKQLAQIAARKAAKAAAPGVVKSMSASEPPTKKPETPERLRSRVRASLLRRTT